MRIINELTVAAVQMTSTDRLEENLMAVERLVKQAVTKNAEMVVLPENFALMAANSKQLVSFAETVGCGDVQGFLSNLAKKYKCWLVAGSFPTRLTNQNKVYATCLVYNNEGVQVAYYHKIHLFDADVADGKGRYRESDTFLAGDKPVVVDTPFGVLGLSICYDLRFPELYRELLEMGAEYIVAPSAFTEVTGRSHWALLCRTRALENSCYLLAANQAGLHSNGRLTYGHSMIVDSWGEVLCELEVDEGLCMATLKRSELKKVRTSLPAITHRRLYT
jgi:nitrilase